MMTLMQYHPRRQHTFIFAAALSSLATLTFPIAARATDISVTSTAAGVTPMYLGYNQGNYYPGSNTSAWVAYSGVNAFRVWASEGQYELDNQTGLQSSSGINTLSDFESRKADLRANPTSTTYTNWSTYNNEFQNKAESGSNEVKLDYALSELQKEDVSPILQITSDTGNFTTWANKWDEWHFYYVMAYNAAQYGVSRFQMYNEPDHTDSSGNPAISPTEWLARMKIASDALRSADQDYDTAHGTALVAQLSGPTGNGASAYPTYGQAAIQTNNVDYAGRTVNYNVLSTFDMHRYGTSTSSFISDINTVRSDMIADSPDHTALPITYTEFNSRDSASYASSTDTADSPTMFTGVADDVLAAMSDNVEAMYAFKFSQTNYDPGTGVDVPQKTGFFYTNNAISPYNTTGATLGAETIRLLSRAFEGQRTRFTTSGSVSSYTTATSYDPGSKNYYFMGVNQNSTGSATSFNLDLSAWGISPGSIVSVEEVSTRRHGEIAQLITVPSDRQITIDQPLQSVWLLTIPSGAAVTPTTLIPTEDAQVRNGSSGSTNYQTTNYGTDTYARIGRSNTDSTGDYVSYFKFNLGKTDPASINRAILQFTGETLNASGTISFHVYGLTDSNWSTSTIDWNNAPDLAGASDSVMQDVGNSAFPVGTLTFGGSISTSGLDITDFLQAHPDLSTLTFALIREEEFAGDSEAGYVRLATSESATPPTLTLFGAAAVPEPSAFAAVGLSMLMLRHRSGQK